MNRKRRHLLAMSVAGIAGLMNGCVTSALFKTSAYTERVSSVLISEDNTKLVVIGQNYHYIFEAPKVLVKTLQARFHKNVSAEIGSFGVDANGKVSGVLTLVLDGRASEQDRQDALALGYTSKLLKSDSKYASEYRFELTGARYKAGGVEPKLIAQKLNTTYSVYVTVAPSAFEQAGKVLLTPVTVGIDGILIIGSIPLILIGVATITTTVAAMCHDKPDCLK